MSAHRDLDRLIQSFLAEGPMELPDPSYDEVRDRMEQKRQRAFIGPWRAPDVNRYLKIGLAAAAVVVIAVIGFQYLGGPNTGSPGATETPQPTATLTATPEPSAAGGLPLGPFTLCEIGNCDVGMTVNISAADWDGESGGGILVKDGGADPADDTGMIVFTGPLNVYADPCRWSGTAPETPATTVDELVAALAAQASRDASAPVDITVDGYAGKSITLHVPDDAAYSAEEFTDCDEGKFGSWTTPGFVAPERYHQGPGQIDQVWVLDVDGTLVTIDATRYEGTSAEDRAELDAILDSLQFELP